MSSQQDVIYGLMNDLEEVLDKGLPLLPNLAVVKKDVVVDILDKLYAALPDEIRLRRAVYHHPRLVVHHQLGEHQIHLGPDQTHRSGSDDATDVGRAVRPILSDQTVAGTDDLLQGRGILTGRTSEALRAAGTVGCLLPHIGIGDAHHTRHDTDEDIQA